LVFYAPHVPSLLLPSSSVVSLFQVGKGTGGAVEANGLLGILTMGGVGGLEQNEARAKALWERAENSGTWVGVWAYAW